MRANNAASLIPKVYAGGGIGGICKLNRIDCKAPTNATSYGS